MHSRPAACLAMMHLLCGVAPPMEAAPTDDLTFEFGQVLEGELIEHEFRLRNDGGAAKRVVSVQMTPPLVATAMPTTITPGGLGIVRLELDTSGLSGSFEGQAAVVFDDSSIAPLWFAGNVVPAIEILPFPAIFLAGVRGEPTTAHIEIVNHESESLDIRYVEQASERFTATLETIEKGQRYRLTLGLDPDGPGGRHTERVRLHTTSETRPVIDLPANTYLRERVYTFPERVDLGTIPLSAIRSQPGLLSRLAQTLMVYQIGGTDFQVSLTSDISALSLQAEAGPDGDRWQTTVALRDEGLRPGQIAGSIVIESNDSEFPRLVVPVRGRILND